MSHRPITEVLLEMRRGALIIEASAMLAEVVAAADRTAKPGELIIKLKVIPSKNDNTVVLKSEVKSKVPRDEIPDALFFCDEDGNLTQNDPEGGFKFEERFDRRTGEVKD